MAPLVTTLFSSMVTDGGAIAQAADQILSAVTTSVSPQTFSVTMPGVLEVGAAMCGSVGGAMVACERRLDIVGVITLGVVTGLGGGLLRDMILPTDSIYMIDHPGVMVACALAAVLVFFFSRAFNRANGAIFYFDILSVALFSFAGADKALTLGSYGFLSCALMGVITAVGGGMLRDMCLGEVPLIFRRSNYYAVASMAGACVYLALVDAHVVKGVAAFACVVVTIALRLLSRRYSLQTPSPMDLTPSVSRAWHWLRRDVTRDGEGCGAARRPDARGGRGNSDAGERGLRGEGDDDLRDEGERQGAGGRSGVDGRQGKGATGPKAG